MTQAPPGGMKLDDKSIEPVATSVLPTGATSLQNWDEWTQSSDLSALAPYFGRPVNGPPVPQPIVQSSDGVAVRCYRAADDNDRDHKYDSSGKKMGKGKNSGTGIGFRNRNKYKPKPAIAVAKEPAPTGTCMNPVCTNLNPVALRCSGCKRAFYCNSNCQAIDWKGGHKLICDDLAKKVPFQSRDDSSKKKLAAQYRFAAAQIQRAKLPSVEFFTELLTAPSS